MVAIGDKVRLEAEGKVTHVQDGVVWFKDSGNKTFAASLEHTKIVEDLHPSDVVLDADSFVYQVHSRMSNGDLLWVEPGSPDVIADATVLRPVQLLVRAGVKTA